MARVKHPCRKQRLFKLLGMTKWAPAWTVPKIYGKGRKVHPSRHTSVKRSWRRRKSGV